MKKIFSFMLLAMLTLSLAACGGDDGIQDDILDCLSNPDAEGCIEDIIDDERSVQEIAADLFMDNWDGDLSHIQTLMDDMDLEDSMEMVTEMYLEVEDSDGEINSLRSVTTDRYVFASTGTVIHRNVAMEIAEEDIDFDIILEETASGVIVYFEVGYLIDLIQLDDEEGSDVLDMIGLSDEWLMFKFDDSLDNLIELEVLKDLMVDAFFEEVGETYFTDLENAFFEELSITAVTAGSDLNGFMMDIIEGDFEAAELKYDAVDFESIFEALDMDVLTPELVAELEEEDVALALEALGLDVDAVILALETSGLLAYFEDATDADLAIMIDYFIDQDNMQDPDLSAMFLAYGDGDLERFLVMAFLEEAYDDLDEIQGLDVDSLMAVMDLVDYDALALEDLDFDALATAIYEGQTSFDVFVSTLTTSAPETASILAEFSDVVLELEELMAVVDEIEYAITNLNTFEQYFTFDYYTDLEFADFVVDANDDFDIVTTITLGNQEYDALLMDILGDVYSYLDGFDFMDLPYVEHINCPTGEVCEEMEDYDSMMADLNALGNMEMTMTFDPTDMGSMAMQMNFADFMNALMVLDEANDGLVNDQDSITSTVNEMYIKVTMSETASATVPTNTFDMNELAEDAAQLSLVLMAIESLAEVASYYQENPSELDLDFGNKVYLNTFDGYINENPAFDLSMSYVEMVGSAIALDYKIQLFWHDETKVFDSPLLVSDLELLFDTDSQLSNSQFMAAVALVDETNFSMTKLLLVLMLEVEDEFPTPSPEEYKY